MELSLGKSELNKDSEAALTGFVQIGDFLD